MAISSAAVTACCILIIEDDIVIQTQLRNLLAGNGYEAETINDFPVAMESIRLGGDAFITKPYNTKILLAKIASLLKRAYPVTEQEALSCNGVSLFIYLTIGQDYIETVITVVFNWEEALNIWIVSGKQRAIKNQMIVLSMLWMAVFVAPIPLAGTWVLTGALMILFGMSIKSLE